MKCPECGSDSFSPETGCFSCGYLPAATTRTDPVPAMEGQPLEEASPLSEPSVSEEPAVPARTSPETDNQPEGGGGRYADDDLPLSELNRMLASLGVEPFPEETETVQNRNVSTEMADRDVRDTGLPPHKPGGSAVMDGLPPPEADLFTPFLEGMADAGLIEPGTQGGYSEENIPDGLLPDSKPLPAAVGKPHPFSRRQLRAARHVAGPLRSLSVFRNRLSGAAAAGFARLHASTGAMLSKWGSGITTGLSLLHRAGTFVESHLARRRQTSAPEAPVEEAQRQGHPLPSVMAKGLQLLFWVGLPVLAAMLTLGMIMGVLALREARLADPNPQPSPPSSWQYVPWTPAPESPPPALRILGE